MRDDFCAFILTHGRPDKVRTYNTLRRSGYTGKIFIVIDDEDKTASEYKKRFGDKVLQFSKSETAKTFDEGDNFGDRRVIVYARNACWALAEKVGCRYFIQLDDDYTNFALRFRGDMSGFYQAIKTSLDAVISSMLDFFIETPIKTVAFSQGGDTIGGTKNRSPYLKRKAMNSFICSVNRRFEFVGRINEDVNTYVSKSIKGEIFFTVAQAQLVQTNTQQSEGGMSCVYADSGTYAKTFYTIMYAPSCVKVGELGDSCRWGNAHYRVHHDINWHRTAPKIIREEHKKAEQRQAA